MKKQETILLTGSRGFIGSETAEELTKNRYLVKPFKGNVVNVKDWENNLKNISIVFHLAGIKTETEKDFQVNFKGTENLFKAIVRSNKKPLKIILASSAVVYRGNKPPFKETMTPKPTTIYGKSKLRAERIVQKYCRMLKISLIIFRYSGVLGPGIRKKSTMSWPLPLWLKSGRFGKPIVVNQKGEQTRDYVHLDDVVSANLLAVEKLPVGIYNVGGGEPIKLKDLALWVQEATKGRSEIVVKDTKPSKVDPKFLFSNIDKLKKHGWKPKDKINEKSLVG